MALLDILLEGDPRLRQKATRIRAADESLRRLSADMYETMLAAPGVGLAAPQIGEPARVIAVDVRGHPKADTDNGLLVLANPRIILAEGSEVAREGCLSIPDLTANVRRATSVVVQHDAGSVRSLGFEARCLQHELDHLDGILFLDRVESLVDDVFRRRIYADKPKASGT